MDGFDDDVPVKEPKEAPVEDGPPEEGEIAVATATADEIAEPFAQPEIPQSDLEAECALLGGLCLEPHRILPIAQLLGSGGRGVFADRRNDDLYAILVKMAGEGEAIDTVTLGHRMFADGKFKSIGGRARIAHLLSFTPSGAHARHHAGIIRNWALLRRLAATGVDIAMRAPLVTPREEEITEFTAEVEDAIRSDFGRVSMSDGPKETAEVFATISARSFPPREIKHDGVKTGLADMDALWGSFGPGQFIVIGGRTSGGKTALAMQVVSNVFANPGSVVVYFSMEMTREELCQRLIAQETGIAITGMRRKQLDDEEWSKVDASVARREAENFIVDETGHPTVGQVQQSTERIRARFGRIDLVVCDGIQLMGAKAENRAQEIGKITRGLKSLAKELQCPLIGTTQLNRGDGTQKNRLPYCRDFKESSSIEQDADIAILLWRPDGSDSKEDPMSAKANVDKHRNGPTSIIELNWSPKHMLFRNAAKPLFAKAP